MAVTVSSFDYLINNFAQQSRKSCVWEIWVVYTCWIKVYSCNIITMGIEMNRFQGEVDEELLCPICSGVLENPLQVWPCYHLLCTNEWINLITCDCQQAPNCEHAFCSGCIHEWLSRQPTCPVDRQNITPPQLRPVPRILRNLLYRYYRVRYTSVCCCRIGINCLNFFSDFNLLVITLFMDVLQY